jgi:hypothetical protein
MSPTPGLAHLDVHDDFYLCEVCHNCDNNLMESKWLTSDEDEADLFQLTDFKAKKT